MGFRRLFGGGAFDWTFTVDGTGTPKVAAATAVTFWDSSLGGAQITDLQLTNGTPASTITTDANGFLPTFWGPLDSRHAMWADAGTGQRRLVFAVGDLAQALIPADWLPTVEELLTSTYLGDVPAAGTAVRYLLGAPIAARILSLDLVAPVDVAQSGTDYWTVQLKRNRGGVTSTIATKTTKPTTGEAISDGQAWSFGSEAWDAAARELAIGDGLYLVLTPTGSPAPLTGLAATLRYLPL